jgi:tRNA nucleotidyltransferase (CCA-adding enzyme)
MDIYLVGGAVRDRLRGLEPADRDWCVTGATPEQMTALGYQRVGRDFPVFLHPETREEYALARGPDGRFSPGTTLEDDLSRRDLTINAMALDADGRLIDPFGGKADLDARVLRHVGAAFGHDPLRVLRVARFAAQLPGFTVAAETLTLMGRLAPRLSAVAAERQWSELHKALTAAAPRRFVEVLREADVLRHFLPELDALFGVPQPPRFHPEIDTGEHMLLAMDRVAALSDDPRVRFAVLVHDLGKGITPDHVLPRHIGHEAAGVPLVEAVCHRLKAPTDYRELALRVCREHLRCHKVLEMRPAKVRELLHAIGAYRQPDALEPFLLACQADAQGRLGMADQPYPSADLLRSAFAASRGVQGRDFIAAGHAPGPKIGELVAREQARRIGRALAQQAS